jgi:hypothetical protein
MEERSRWIVLNGQPNAVQHVCDLCMRVFLLPDGTLSACQSIHPSAYKSDSLVIIASEMPGNRWGRFEHGSTMLWRIQVPGALAEQPAQILCASFWFS